MKPEELGFWNWAQRDPDRTALIVPGPRKTSFGELFAESNRVAYALRAMDLRPGDALAVIMPNCIEFYEIYLAALQTGLYFTPINHYLATPEVAYVLSDCEAKAFFVHSQFATTAKEAVEQIDYRRSACFSVGGGPFEAYEDVKARRPATLPADRRAGISMIYTSGTTGYPKGVRAPLPDEPPEGPTATRVMSGALIGWQPGNDVYLLNGPLHHSAPISFSTIALHLGHAVVLTDKWDAETTLRLIEENRVINTQMVPIHFHRLLKLPEDVRRKYDVSSIKTILHSAAPCPVATKKAIIDWFGPVVFEYYGGTEGGATMVTSQEWLDRPGTVGRPWPGTELKIFDDDGKELPPGEVGAIYFKTMLGPPNYFKDARKSEAVRRGEYFTLGDVGYVDPDGWLYLVDRKADMLVSGGVNIYPAEIEAVLLQHPAVTDVAVFGVPNVEWGEEVKAVIETATENPDDMLRANILAFCEGKLARYKIPRSIEFSRDLPRAPNGKLYKRQIRERYWKGRDERI